MVLRLPSLGQLPAIKNDIPHSLATHLHRNAAN
jgi:hypothetical protein